MNTLISMARGLLSTDAAMMAPCSVKAHGATARESKLGEVVTVCDHLRRFGGGQLKSKVLRESPDIPFDRLSRGETESISLALEVSASRLIVDDLQARRLAASLGPAIVGTTGLLIAPKE